MANEFDLNEGLTRREALKRGAMLGGALVWAVPVVQTIGMSAAMAEETSRICHPQTPESIRSYLQGNRRDGSNVLPGRSNPSAVLSGPDGVYFSLGFGGTITLDFGNKVFSLGGANVLVIEVTNNPGSYPDELARVEVSTNASSWTQVGIASSKVAVNTFPVGLDSFKYARMTDISNPAIFPLPEYQHADGFDIDVVKVTCQG